VGIVFATQCVYGIPSCFLSTAVQCPSSRVHGLCYWGGGEGGLSRVRPNITGLWPTCTTFNVISAPSLSTFRQRLKHFCSRPLSLTLSLIPVLIIPHLQWILKWFYYLDHCNNTWMNDWLIDWLTDPSRRWTPCWVTSPTRSAYMRHFSTNVSLVAWSMYLCLCVCVLDTCHGRTDRDTAVFDWLARPPAMCEDPGSNLTAYGCLYRDG